MLDSLFKKVEARKSIKRRLQHRRFPVDIAKFLGTAFSLEQLWWLLLELRLIFTLWYITLKIYENSMTQTWSDDFFLVRFSHPGKYSYEIPHGEGISWGKLNGIASLSLFLFSNSNFRSRICCHFFRTTLFW